jgi:hypothetical protein
MYQEVTKTSQKEASPASQRLGFEIVVSYGLQVDI